MPDPRSIVIKGAREHNLKNLDLTLPRDKLIVITGLSGSGKSSLAFDTIYAEGQRRYVESLSAYARQFLGQMDKPDVDSIEGLSPAIAIEQRGAGSNPRSTVATVTEIYDYLRLLFSRVGVQHCPKCGTLVDRLTVAADGRSRLAESVETALKLGEGRVAASREGAADVLFSQGAACPSCGTSVEELQPRSFSFNSPYGACRSCDGLGTQLKV